MQFLYVCHFSNGHIKVGRSVDPQSRIASQGNAFSRPYSAEPSVFTAKSSGVGQGPGRKPGEHLFDTPAQSDKQMNEKVQIKYASRGKK